MLGHTAHHGRQLPHLMTDRLTDRLAVAQAATAAIAALGRMHQRLIGIADHLTTVTLMARLPTRLTARALPRRTPGRLGRIARRRPRTIARVLPQPPIELGDLGHQHIHPLKQRSVLHSQLPKLVRAHHPP